ncbi:uracil-DNA glycosylase family protein [Pseudophaeobacter arcticus]|jgi:uracil-DNA glycosylase|uniref:uracil-DNA glycosylase family protein n=2 Tax=Pseudophaeobacter arcticus TaxID=385492 RepID=UPI00360C2EAD
MADSAPDHGPAEIERLRTQVAACTACAALPLGPRPIVQIGAGARILIAGQAPGRRTHLAGRPFDDASGVRLRHWLGLDAATFWDPAKVAILPMGFCFPGTGPSGDLPPRPECAPRWRQPLLDALSNVRLTVVIGRHAQAWHLPETMNLSLGNAMRDWRTRWPEVILLPHPSPRNASWFRRNAWFEEDVLPMLQTRVEELLGDPPT